MTAAGEGPPAPPGRPGGQPAPGPRSERGPVRADLPVDGAVERWSELVTRVLAPNPSAMTLEGTNTYVVAAGDSRTALVIDPGPLDFEHVERVVRATEGRMIELVLLTHTHIDHAEGAAAFAERAGAPLAAIDRGWATPDAPGLGPGTVLRAAGVVLEAVPTPGHAADHCCFWLGVERAMFTGDHILGRGTTVVEWPGGDMSDYLASLETVRSYQPSRLYPGHGPLVTDAAGTIAGYVDHRMERQAQVLDGLRAGDRTPAELVRRIYADVDPGLHPFAELSVRAHLVKLVRDGTVHEDGERFTPAP
jgi:glyoxylase-like metal-dependent hydrolase (beta-lactamase superfamily II)